MRRRIQVPNELPERSHTFTPRKFRSYGAPGVFMQQNHGGLPGFPLSENKSRVFVPPASNTFPKKFADNFAWLTSQIGKVYIPDGYLPFYPEKNNWVTEKELAIYSKPYDFDLHYLGRTKPMADLLPARLNVYLDTNNVIMNVRFE
jgi:hypothetical protein